MKLFGEKSLPAKVVDENFGDTTLDGLGKKIIGADDATVGEGFGQIGYGKIKSQGADFSHGVALYLENISVWLTRFGH